MPCRYQYCTMMFSPFMLWAVPALLRHMLWTTEGRGGNNMYGLMRISLTMPSKFLSCLLRLCCLHFSARLRRFTRHDILESLAESTARPKDCMFHTFYARAVCRPAPTAYALFNTSASVTKMVRQGLLAHIGAHGEPPLGVNYHAEMFFTQQGGLSNYEVCWDTPSFQIWLWLCVVWLT